MNRSQRAKQAVDDILAANGAAELEVDRIVYEPRRGLVAMLLRKKPVVIEGQAQDVPGRPIDRMNNAP